MIVWMFSTLFPPYTGGAASDSDLLMRHVAASPDVRHVFLVTEYHPSGMIRRGDKHTVLRVLPRRDSLRDKNRLADIFRFALYHLIILAILVGIGVAARRHIIHIHGRLIYRWTAATVGLFRLRAVADVRDLFGDPQLYGKFAAATGVSLAIAETLIPVMPADRVFTIPVPIDPAEMAAARAAEPARPAGGRPYFLFVGTLAENKGIRELVEAYLRYTAMAGDGGADLVVVGDNYLTPPLDTKNAPRIHLLGSVPRAEVYALMKGADRVILPSRMEGLPRVCIEAIAMDVPVICPHCVIEFREFCPQCVLPEVSVPAILEMLRRPREDLFAKGFPIEIVEITHVTGATLEVFRRLDAKVG